ncbi:hypothetical protein [Nocardioides sp. URHA0032]|uniref:hypothetical protein n=1 Tax=Nocardioides sp. URHA0032 TaxID=1380388 RepID=UPI00056BDEB6|nr:hypothetical protein [Nocardioides sp. URHA0032]
MATIPTGPDVLAWAGLPQNDVALSMQADKHVSAVAHMIWAYTNGKGFQSPGNNQLMIDNNPTVVIVAPEIRSVILSAAARSLSNPTQARRIEAGSYSELPGSLASWSLLETLTLNRFRRRTA